MPKTCIAKCVLCLSQEEQSKQLPLWCGELEIPCLALKPSVVMDFSNDREKFNSLWDRSDNGMLPITDEVFDTDFIKRMKGALLL